MKQELVPEVTIQELVEQEPKIYKGRMKNFWDSLNGPQTISKKSEMKKVTIQELAYQDRARYEEKLEGFNQYIKQDREKHGKDVEKFLYSLNRKHKPKKGLARSLIAGGMALGMGLSGLTTGCATTKSFSVEPKLSLLIPVSEEEKIEQGYKPSFAFGVAGTINIGEIAEGEVEALAFGSSKEYEEPVKASVKTGSILAGANASLYPLSLFLEQIPKLNPEVVFGINALGEFTEIEIPDFDVHEKMSSAMFGLRFGIGAKLFRRIHGRFSYIRWPGSENLLGVAALDLGYCFIFGEPIWSTE